MRRHPPSGGAPSTRHRAPEGDHPTPAERAPGPLPVSGVNTRDHLASCGAVRNGARCTGTHPVRRSLRKRFLRTNDRRPARFAASRGTRGAPRLGGFRGRRAGSRSESTGLYPGSRGLRRARLNRASNRTCPRRLRQARLRTGRLGTTRFARSGLRASRPAGASARHASPGGDRRRGAGKNRRRTAPPRQRSTVSQHLDSNPASPCVSR